MLPVRRPRRRTTYSASRPDASWAPSAGAAVKPAQHREAAPKAGLRGAPALGILAAGRDKLVAICGRPQCRQAQWSERLLPSEWKA
jgi:hypothetical protein